MPCVEFFFFQAEDGIRDVAVTGVQTCALPISPAPLQEAVAVGLETLGDDYYERLVHEYRARRDLLCRALVDAGFRCTPPQGAYYVLADYSAISELPDDAFSLRLTKGVGVAAGAGPRFFSQ